MFHHNGILSVLLTGLLALMSGGVASATPVTVTNFSFELPVLTDGTNSVTLALPVPGWTAIGSFGALNPTAAMFASVPNGDNTAFSNGGTFSQTLGTTLLNLTKYTLNVAVGDRSERFFPVYTIELRTAGGTLLGSSSTPIPGNGLFATSTVVYDSLVLDPNFGQQLRIDLVATGPFANTQANFDNVQLDASPIPEPTTLFLLGTGLLGLLGFARRGRKPVA